MFNWDKNSSEEEEFKHANILEFWEGKDTSKMIVFHTFMCWLLNISIKLVEGPHCSRASREMSQLLNGTLIWFWKYLHYLNVAENTSQLCIDNNLHRQMYDNAAKHG